MSFEQTTPPPIDAQKEMQAQTALLRSINGKLGFIIFVILVTAALNFFNWLI
jgi:hypothetical protein